jgi:Tfp pilus assembly protein PilE
VVHPSGRNLKSCRWYVSPQWSFIAIIAVLAAILFPVFAQAREKARMASCISPVKQIALSIMMYTQDYDEVLKPRRRTA